MLAADAVQILYWEAPALCTIRVWFTKTGAAAYISLLDLQRVMQRALKRSRLPVWYTLGFNPHIYMTFSAPLSLGQESICETFDFKTEADGYDWGSACDTLSSCLPQGIDVLRMEPAVLDANDIASADYTIRYAPEHTAAARAAWMAYNAASNAEAIKNGKHGKKKTLNLKEFLPEAVMSEENDALTVSLRLPVGNLFTVNPALVLGWLEQTQGLPAGNGTILRTGIYTKDGKKFS